MSAGFSHRQLKRLATPLDRMRVLTREVDGKQLSYIEGWFAIAEANRIFGYDGWDREMVHFERVFERGRKDGFDCGYMARVRVRVRATATTVVREGTGFGHASAALQGDAHERALKAAETDATKRALATFGGRFGLLLYDKEQSGQKMHGGSLRGGARAIAAPDASGTEAQRRNAGPYVLIKPDGTSIPALSAEAFCRGMRQLIDGARNGKELDRLKRDNDQTLAALRRSEELMTGRGEHYVEVLEKLFLRRGKVLRLERPSPVAASRGVPASEPARDIGNGHAARAHSGVDGQGGPHATEDFSEAGPENGAPQNHAPNDEQSAIVIVTPLKGAYRAFEPVPPYPLEKALRVFGGRERDSGSSGDICSSEVASERDTHCAGLASPDPSAPHQVGALAGAGDDAGALGSRAAIDGVQPTRVSLITGAPSIDKSILALSSDRRLRSKAHLVRVAARACVVCEDAPCHAHHVTFAQSRGLSQKVSDEFTVPLCVPHHNALHMAGSEIAWWREQGVDPLPIARALWEENLRTERELREARGQEHAPKGNER